jgi:hypothetical protein
MSFATRRRAPFDEVADRDTERRAADFSAFLPVTSCTSILPSPGAADGPVHCQGRPLAVQARTGVLADRRRSVRRLHVAGMTPISVVDLAIQPPRQLHGRGEMKDTPEVG